MGVIGPGASPQPPSFDAPSADAPGSFVPGPPSVPRAVPDEDVPEGPDVPEVPGAPDVPEVPGAPDVPDVPDDEASGPAAASPLVEPAGAGSTTTVIVAEVAVLPAVSVTSAR